MPTAERVWVKTNRPSAAAHWHLLTTLSVEQFSAELFFPWQIAADAAGNVYIGEWNTLRIRKISPDGIITTIAGNGMRG